MFVKPWIVWAGVAALVAALAGIAIAQPVKHLEGTAEPSNPAPNAAAAGDEIAVIKTRLGNIEIEFFEKDAPEHVKNFKKLAREGYFDGTAFHRLIPGLLIQAGDPNTKDADPTNDGLGGPGYTLPAEIKQLHKRGSVAAARLPDPSNPEKRSSGSQFYICLKPVPQLDRDGYTVFARVVKGMDVVDKIAGAAGPGKPKDPVRMVSVTIVAR